MRGLSGPKGWGTSLARCAGRMGTTAAWEAEDPARSAQDAPSHCPGQERVRGGPQSPCDVRGLGCGNPSVPPSLFDRAGNTVNPSPESRGQLCFQKKP